MIKNCFYRTKRFFIYFFFFFLDGISMGKLPKSSSLAEIMVFVGLLLLIAEFLWGSNLLAAYALNGL